MNLPGGSKDHERQNGNQHSWDIHQRAPPSNERRAAMAPVAAVRETYGDGWGMATADSSPNRINSHSDWKSVTTPTSG